MKKVIIRAFAAIMTVIIGVSMTACHEADPEFVHTDNLITTLYMSTSLQGTQYPFTIKEYNAAGELVAPADVTPESVAGGYGVASIEFPVSQMEAVDLTKVFLTANVTYDVIIRPGLQGAHDITGDGIVVTVTGGDGKSRKYRIYGEYTAY